MCDSNLQCITRLVGSGDLQLAQLHEATQRIEAALGDMPLAQRSYVRTALLNFAARHILLAQAAQHTSGASLHLNQSFNLDAACIDAAAKRYG